MIYPLKWWSGYGYRFWQWTWYGVHHKGTDFIISTGKPVYAVMDGRCDIRTGWGGGKQIWQYGTGGYSARYMHLSAFAISSGRVARKGDLIGWSGNSGALTRGSGHLHFDLQINGRWVNPLLYLSKTPQPQVEDILKDLNMEYPELIKKLERDKFVKKDERFTFYPNGKPAIVNHGKQYFPKLGDMAIIYMKMARPIREVEKGYPVVRDRREVLR